MTFTLDRIVPWGRTFDEYRAMFALSTTDLEGRILGCGDGPASFNAAHRRPRTSTAEFGQLPLVTQSITVRTPPLVHTRFGSRVHACAS